MIRTLALVVWASFALAPIAQAAPTKSALSKSHLVDGLFAKWNSPTSPGASVAVLQDGKLIYSRGYGMASLEYGVPNTATTVFHIASLSKQFTAFAVLLLAQDGKLSLDDDIRKYLPEMHDFGTPITIRQLLHHTSGLRDQWNLLALAGWRLDDEITERDVLDLLWRQKELNFRPGDQMLYSNTGYTLLGVIVKRVSGMPLSQFTKDRIFRPLGMAHTHFQNEYSNVVKNRAYSYNKGQDGAYKYVALSYSTVGPSSLFTTVEDLAKWDENFYTGKVGGKLLIADLQLQGKLNSGEQISYADGLNIRKYRGLKTVSHDGGDAGYRTNILRFPDQHFSVIVLSNAGDMEPGDISYEIADAYLGHYLEPNLKRVSAKGPPLKVISINPKLLQDYVGDYAFRPSFLIHFTLENDQLMAQATGQPKLPVYPSGNDIVFWKVVDAHFTFERAADGSVTGGVHHQNGSNMAAKRITQVELTPDQLKDLAGDYYSEELAAIYSVSVKDGHLSVRYPRGELALQQTAADQYSTEFPIGTLQFTRAADGTCSGFTIGDGRVRKLRFDKVSIAPRFPLR